MLKNEVRSIRNFHLAPGSSNEHNYQLSASQLASLKLACSPMALNVATDSVLKYQSRAW